MKFRNLLKLTEDATNVTAVVHFCLTPIFAFAAILSIPNATGDELVGYLWRVELLWTHLMFCWEFELLQRSIAFC